MQFALAVADVQRAALQVATSSSESEGSGGGGGLTNFELLTAAAYLTFSRSTDVAVIEVGVGGLRDATNVIERPAVSVITSVAFDHADLLGNSIANIAREKAGIIKPGCPAVIGPMGDPEAAEQIQTWANEIGSGELHWSTPSTPMVALADGDGGTAGGMHLMAAEAEGWAVHDRSGIEYPLVLGGEYQLANSAVALDTLRVLQASWGSSSRQDTTAKVNSNSAAGPAGAVSLPVHVSDSAMAEGMRNVHWPGRLQWSNWPACVPYSGCGGDGSSSQAETVPAPVLLDGAHNPAAAIALRSYVDGIRREHGGPVVWVIALSLGKYAPGLLRTFLSEGDSVAFVPFPSPEGMPWVTSMNTTTLLDIATQTQAQTAGGEENGKEAERIPKLHRAWAVPDAEGLCLGEDGPDDTGGCLVAALSQARDEAERRGAACTVVCGSLYLVGDFLRLDAGDKV